MPRNGSKPKLKRLRDASLLEISDSIIAGRHSSCGIDLSDEEGASRKHARFNIIDGQLTITDLGSLNGTLVNGVEIETTHMLQDSDIIVFDSEKYLLKLPRLPRSQPQQHPTASSTADTVIANKAELQDPTSIEPEIRIITDEPVKPVQSAPAEPQHANTVEYLNSLPNPDMKRPVGMPEQKLVPSRGRKFVMTWVLPAIMLAVFIAIAYQLGLRAA